VSIQKVVSSDSLPIAEFAALFGFPVEAVVTAVETQRQRASARQAFYTIAQLTDRWHCSRAQVYSVLREANVRVVDIGQGAKRSKTLVPVETVERIERLRTGKM
jgi:hypothetical protein